MISLPLWAQIALGIYAALATVAFLLVLVANIHAEKVITKLEREKRGLKVDLDLCREFASAKVKRRVLREGP